jgi:hypothetical protein
MRAQDQARLDVPPGTYHSYPIPYVVVYNTTTAGYFLIGAFGIALIGMSGLSIGLAIAYLVFALGQAYVYMPLQVCPHCAYARIRGGRCVSGMDCVSRTLRSPRDPGGLSRRERDPLGHNTVFHAALLFPLFVMLVGFAYGFSWPLAVTFLLAVGLLALRIHLVLPHVACAHCASRRICPNARSMGVAD